MHGAGRCENLVPELHLGCRTSRVLPLGNSEQLKLFADAVPTCTVYGA